MESKYSHWKMGENCGGLVVGRGRRRVLRRAKDVVVHHTLWGAGVQQACVAKVKGVWRRSTEYCHTIFVPHPSLSSVNFPHLPCRTQP